MEVTKQITTNVPDGLKPGFGPMKLFTHMHAFPRATSRKWSTRTSPFAKVKWLRTWKRSRSPFSSRPTTTKTDVLLPEFFANVSWKP